MKVSKGQANPGQVNQILAQKLNNWLHYFYNEKIVRS
jgi:hypothetical protein